VVIVHISVQYLFLLPQHVLLETPCQDKDKAKPTPWFEYEGLALNW
jgi:hypothetical protein